MSSALLKLSVIQTLYKNYDLHLPIYMHRHIRPTYVTVHPIKTQLLLSTSVIHIHIAHCKM